MKNSSHPTFYRTTRSKPIKIFLMCFMILFIAACGVKGKPLPPLKSAPIGYGEPNFREATEKINVKKSKTKPKSEDDWSDDEDFYDNPEKK